MENGNYNNILGLRVWGMNEGKKTGNVYVVGDFFRGFFIRANLGITSSVH